MTSVTLTDLSQEQNITLSVDSANNSVAISQTTVTPTLSISLSAAGEVNTASNVGTGAQVYKEKVGTDLRLRTLIGGTGIYAITNNEDITFSLGDVNGEIDTDLIPDGNETRDLGSLTNRWRDLYLSGTSIDLGGASITSNGTIVALPADSTAGGFRILTTNDDTDSIGEGTTNLFYTSARFNTDFATKDTDDLTEGTTNQYYTDARSRGAVSVTQAAASGDGTLSYNSTTGVITYTPPDLSGYLTSFTETVTSLSIASNTLTYTDENGATTDIDLSLYLDDTNLARLTSGTLDGATGIATFTRDDATTFTVDFSDLLNITFADLSVTQNAASGNGTLTYNNTNGVFTYTPPDLSSYIDLTDLSVTQAVASGNGTLSYNNTSGVFTYTPPDLSGYLTSYTETDPVFSAHTTSNITNGTGFLVNNGTGTWSYDNSTYLTTETNDLTAAVTWANVPDANITQTSVTQHQAALSITQSQITDLDHYTDSDVDTHLNTSTATTNQILSWTGTDYAWVADSDVSGIELTDLSVSPQTPGTASLTYDNTTGVFSYTPPDLTAYLTDITAENIGDLSDVTITSVNDNDLLQYNSTSGAWENVPVAGISNPFDQDLNTTDDVTFVEVTASEFIGPVRGSTILKAQAGEALSAGDVVYVSGISGNTPIVSKADADDASKMPAFGLARATVSLNAEVDVTLFGEQANLDTTGPGSETWSTGDVLYVSTTAGVLTNIKPSGESSLLQNIGRVEKVHASTGKIIVSGAGRTNATPNLNDGNIFIGDSTNCAVTATLDTSIVPENTNLYYTDARARAALSGGTGVTYNSTTGEIAIGQAVETNSNVTFNDVQIDGDLTVSGTTTTINTATLNVADNQVVLNSDVTGAPTENAGIVINRGTSPDKSFLWYETQGMWSFNGEEVRTGDLKVYGNLTFPNGDFMIGDIYADDGTSIVLQNGTNGTDASFTGDVTGDVTGNLTGNVFGTVSSIANHDTDNLAEGSTNLYYTNARANTAIDARVTKTFVENLDIDVDGGTY